MTPRRRQLEQPNRRRSTYQTSKAVQTNRATSQVAHALREKFPKLVDMMDASREDVLAYMAFPKDHWAQIASTNPLERVNKEIKRRADVIGIFPNDAAVVRLVGALMLEQNDEWAVSRRYMTLETLGSVSHNPMVSLPALAA
ncbi:transposase [Novosphingobium sp. BW1]|uniref:transposase n=1 Tax=Novosphingobium sp. BW1 TaxID=2592621 RepID=UPI00210FEF77|nr:transposase [Novosphingobium sp. BW1]